MASHIGGHFWLPAQRRNRSLEVISAWLVDYAHALLEVGEPEKALKMFQRAITVQKNQIHALVGYADILTAKQQFPQVRPLLEYALDCAQSKVGPRDEVPMVQEAVQRCREAFMKKRQADRLEELNPELLRSKKGRLTAELHYAQRAATPKPREATAKPVRLHEIKDIRESSTAGVAKMLSTVLKLKADRKAVKITPIPVPKESGQECSEGESENENDEGEGKMSPQKRRVAALRAQLLEDARAGALARKKAMEDRADKPKAVVPSRYSEYSCLCVPHENCARKEVIALVEWPWFDRVMLIAILLNCALLALYDPGDPDCESSSCQDREFLSSVFTLFFTLEMVLKIFAMGAFGKKSYLSDSWNRFDFIVVLISLLDFLPFSVGGSAFKALRAVRVLRPLRALNKVPALRLQATLLIETLPMLSNVVTLLGFVFVVFAVVAVQLWAGLFTQRCTDPSTAAVLEADPPYLCTLASGTQECPNVSTNYTLCKVDQGPNLGSGTVGYDNTAIASLTVFQVITTEGWSDIMYRTREAYSPYVWPYFVSVVVIGNFFALNMFLVVITNQFAEVKEREYQAMEKIRLEEEAIQRTEDEALIHAVTTDMADTTSRLARQLRESGLPVEAKLVQGVSETATATTSKKEMVLLEEEVTRVRKALHDLTTNDTGAPVPGRQTACEVFEILKLEFLNLEYSTCAGKLKKFLSQGKLPLWTVGCNWGICGYRFSCRRRKLDFESIVDSTAFTTLITLAIFVNTLFMTSEHAGQSAGYESLCETANFVFTVLFTFEMLLKLLAFGPRLYFMDSMNSFDAFIVMVSWMEYGLGSEGGLSVLRAFRIMRIFKMIRFMPGLQVQLNVVACSVSGLGSFLVILMLIVFIFAILGMYLFGTTNEDNERPNFDTFLSANLAVFTLVSGEDWNQLMYRYVAETSWIASFYFVSMVMIGKYICCSLFVAILLEGFAEQQRVEETNLREMVNEERQRDGAAMDKIKHMLGGRVNGFLQEMFEYWKASTEFLRSMQQSGVMPGSKKQARAMKVISYMLACSSSGSAVPYFFNFWKEQNLIAKMRRHERGTAKHKKRTDNAFHLPPELRASATPTKLPPLTKNPPSTSVRDDTKPMPSLSDSKTGTGSGASMISSDWTVPPNSQTSAKVAVQEKEITERYQEVKRACWDRDRTLCLFPYSHSVRRCALCIVNLKCFDHFILAVIIASAVLMALESPTGEQSDILVLIDLGITGIFCIEALLKVLANGFYFNGPSSYLRCPWNRLDFFLVMVALVTLLFEIINMDNAALAWLRVLRVMRTLRPLRMIRRFHTLQIMMRTLAAAIRPISQTLLIAFIATLVLGVLGIQLFKGAMYSCHRLTGAQLEAVDDETSCVAAGGTWQNAQYNFDNMGEAIITLFFIYSGDGWITIMYSGMDVRGVGLQPKEDAKPAAALYFVMVYIIGNIFLVNMFVGVMVDNFGRMAVLLESAPKPRSTASIQPEEELYEDDFEKGLSHCETEEDERAELAYIVSEKTEAQQNIWAEQAEELHRSQIKEDEHRKLRSSESCCYRVVASAEFEFAIAIVIVLNMICMMGEHHNQSEGFENILGLANLGFTAIFVLEMLLKLIVLGVREYFESGWNCFDFVVTLISVAALFVGDLLEDTIGVEPTLLRVLRVMRVARILRLFKASKGLQALLAAIGDSLPQVVNLMALLALVFFIFGCASVKMFGKVSCAGISSECAGLDQAHAHFQTFPLALLTLFRMGTGDNGSGILQDLMREAPYCDSGSDCEENCCANQILAPMFFVVFTVCAQYIILSIMVALLMTRLSETTSIFDKIEQLEQEQEYKCKIQQGLGVHPSTSATVVPIEGAEAEDLEKRQAPGWFTSQPTSKRDCPPALEKPEERATQSGDWFSKQDEGTEPPPKLSQEDLGDDLQS